MILLSAIITYVYHLLLSMIYEKTYAKYIKKFVIESDLRKDFVFY